MKLTPVLVSSTVKRIIKRVINGGSVIKMYAPLSFMWM